MAGLFDYQSPENMRAARLDPLLVSPAQMGQQSLLNRLVSQMSNAGANIGATGAGMMGLQLPEEARQQQVQSIMQGVDQNDVAGLTAAAKQLSDIGETKGAQSLIDQANKAEALGFARQDRAAAQAQLEAAATQKENLKAAIGTRVKGLNQAEIAALASDPKAVAGILNPKVETEVVEAGGQRLLIDSISGATIKNLGTASKTGTSVSLDLGGGGLKRLGNDINSFNDSVKDAQEAYGAARTAKDSINLAIASNSTTAWEAARGIIVRAQGDKRVSNADINRTGTSREILQSFKDVLSSWTTGIPNEKTQKDLFAYASLLERINGGKINSESDRWREGSLGVADLTPDQLDLYFPKVQVTPKAPAAKTGNTAPTGGNTVSWNDMPSTVTPK